MTDSITLIMFVFPAALAAIFSFITIIPKGRDNDKNGGFLSASAINLFCAIVASICWSIFALMWPALATQNFMLSVAYLWYALSALYAVFAVAVAVRMLGDITKVEDAPKLTLKYWDE